MSIGFGAGFVSYWGKTKSLFAGFKLFKVAKHLSDQVL